MIIYRIVYGIKENSRTVIKTYIKGYEIWRRRNKIDLVINKLNIFKIKHGKS